MNVRNYKLALVAAVAAFAFPPVVNSSLLGLAAGSDLTDLRNDLNNQLNQMRSMMDTNLQTALRAIPGSEWTEVRYWMFQDCSTYTGDDHNKCVTKQTQARAYLDKMRQATGTAPDTPYQVSVYVEGQGVNWTAVRMDVFQTYFADVEGTGAQAFITQELRKREFRPYALVEGAFLRRPISDAEVSAKIDAAAQSMYDTFVQLGPPLPSYGYGIAPVQPLTFGPSALYQHYMTDCQTNHRVANIYNDCPAYAKKMVHDSFTKSLKQAVMAPYENVADNRTVGRLTTEWEALSVAQHLVLVMPIGDVNTVFSRGGSIKVQVHEKDHPEKPHPRSRLLQLRRQDFKDNLAINDTQRGYGALVYAIIYMQDTTAMGLDVVDDLMKQRAALQKLMDANRPMQPTR